MTNKSAKYHSVKMLLNKFDPFFEHPLGCDQNVGAKIDDVLTLLTSLEMLFLPIVYLKCGFAIRANFNKALKP